MRYIDMQNWPRRKHFEFFNTFDYPHFSICANLNITAFDTWLKKQRFSFTVATVYALARSANTIPEFRYRIRNNRVVDHELVHPSPTILTGDDLFSFSTIRYVEDFTLFSERAEQIIEHRKENPTLEDEPGQDDLLFMTSIPWVSFTSFTHPIHMHPADSVPRLAWGKYFHDGEQLKMPLSVQVHHALMDGIHVGRYFARVQEYLDCPEILLNIT
jgi:chloramphenicol O-acetyltransferase type A